MLFRSYRAASNRANFDYTGKTILGAIGFTAVDDVAITAQFRLNLAALVGLSVAEANYNDLERFVASVDQFKVDLEAAIPSLSSDGIVSVTAMSWGIVYARDGA